MRNLKLRRVVSLAMAGSALAAFAGPALAQQAPAPTAPAAADSTGVADITVTARRRNESIETTPVAISAVTSASLEARGTINIGDLQGAVPNLLITQQNSGGSSANLSIRGLSYADVEKSQAPTVGVYVDGAVIGTSTGQFMDLFDIDTIEVLRGPQGTLFGRNTIGGVINIRRTLPKDEFSEKLEASYGSYDTWTAKGLVTGPLIKGLLDFKAFMMHDQSAGYYHNAVTGKHAGGDNNLNYGLALRLTPSNNFDALLTVEQQQDRFDVVNSNIAQTGELFCLFEPANQCNRNTTTDLYTIFNSPGVSKYRAPSGTLEMNLRVGGIKFTSVTNYRETHEFQTQDFDASTADLYAVRRVQDYKQFSQELRAGGNILQGLDFVGGLYYFNSSYTFSQYSRVLAAALGTAGDVMLDGQLYSPNAQIENPKNKSYAGFVDFDYQFLEKFRLSFGGRYTHDQVSLLNYYLPAGPGLTDTIVNPGNPISFSKFTPKVGLDYRPNSDAMVYASWSRGYRSGGFSPRSNLDTPYGPETVDAYEVGAKLTLLDRKLIFNIDGFYSNYKSLQQSTTIPGGPTGNQTLFVNVGSAKIKGIEADFTARPTTDWTFTGSLGTLSSHFNNFILGNVYTGATPAASGVTNFDYSSNNLIYAPKFTGDLAANYKHDIGMGDLLLHVGYRYIAPYDEQISVASTTPAAGTATTLPALVKVNGNDPRVRTKVQNLVDASIGLDFNLSGAKAHFSVYGRNLADVKTTSAAFTVAGLWSFASAIEPRTFGAKLGIEF